MAKNRMINTKFWIDPFVLDYLDPLEKLVYIYLITNPYTNICGIYELPLKVMGVETGIETDNLKKVIIPRLEKYGKIKYKNGWVALKNFIKNQNEGSDDVKLGIKRELDKVPQELRGWVEGLGRVSVTKPNLTKPNLTPQATPSVAVGKQESNEIVEII